MAKVKTYAAGRVLNMPGNKPRLPGFHTLGSGDWERGELVPEAHTILRLDSFLHSGHLDEVEVEEEEFRAAIAKYCPEMEEQILLNAGVAPGVVLTGTESTPVQTEQEPEAAADVPEDQRPNTPDSDPEDTPEGPEDPSTLPRTGYEPEDAQADAPAKKAPAKRTPAKRTPARKTTARQARPEEG